MTFKKKRRIFLISGINFRPLKVNPCSLPLMPANSNGLITQNDPIGRDNALHWGNTPDITCREWETQQKISHYNRSWSPYSNPGPWLDVTALLQNRKFQDRLHETTHQTLACAMSTQFTSSNLFLFIHPRLGHATCVFVCEFHIKVLYKLELPLCVLRLGVRHAVVTCNRTDFN